MSSVKIYFSRWQQTELAKGLVSKGSGWLRTLAAAFMVVSFAGTARATTYYLDCTATNGLNNGTSWANAWTSLTQAEVNTPGCTTIYISGGTSNQVYSTGYIDYSYRVVQVGQDAGHNGMVIFDGQGTQAQFFIEGQKYCTISGDNGSGDGQAHMSMINYAIQVAYGDGSHNVKLDHLNLPFTTVRFQNAVDIEIAYCNLSAPNNSDYLISFFVRGDDGSTAYTNNSIHNCNLLAPRAFASLAQPGEGSDFIQGGINCSVYSNNFNVYFANFTEGQHQDGWQTAGPYIALYDNVMQNIPNYGLYCEFTGSAGNIRVYNNLIVQNAPISYDRGLNVGIVIGPQGVNGATYNNIVVANNTFVDMFGRSAIAMGQYGTTNTYTNCYIVNNIVYDSGNAQFSALAFDNNGVNGASGTNGVVIAYNEIEAGGNGTTGASPQLATPNQLLAIAGTPKINFVSYVPISTNNDLHLAATDTAARKRGMNLGYQFPFLRADKDGMGLPAAGAWDIGAYQYMPGNAPSATIPVIQGFRVIAAPSN